MGTKWGLLSGCSISFQQVALLPVTRPFVSMAPSLVSWIGMCDIMRRITVIPRLTSDTANEDFFRCFLDSANEYGFG